MTAVPRPVFDATIISELAHGRHEMRRAQLDAAAKKLRLRQRQRQQQQQQQQVQQQQRAAEKQQLAAAASHDRARSLVPYSAESKPRTVHALVDICCCVISSVWAPPRTYQLPLKTFVHEVLRRSRVQYPVFQVALCYIMQLKPIVEQHAAAGTLPAGLSCGRRVFVAALQVASKYLQDRSYSVKSWAKISGLEVADLKANELALLNALNWEMHIPYEAYLRCCKRLRLTIDHAQSRAQRVQQVREQQRRESQQASVYATPTASPATPTLAAPAPAPNTTESGPAWNY